QQTPLDFIAIRGVLLGADDAVRQICLEFPQLIAIDFNVCFQLIVFVFVVVGGFGALQQSGQHESQSNRHHNRADEPEKYHAVSFFGWTFRSASARSRSPSDSGVSTISSRR